jgi:hypothetical protein
VRRTISLHAFTYAAAIGLTTVLMSAQATQPPQPTTQPPQPTTQPPQPTTQPPQTTTQPPQATQPPAQPTPANAITVTGCLRSASPTPDASATVGTTGTAGSTATGTTGTAGDPSQQRFVLMDATRGPAASPDTSTATPDSTARAQKDTYRLIANPSALAQHVGKTLELTGTLEEASAASQDTSAGAFAGRPMLRVLSGKIVGATCEQK